MHVGLPLAIFNTSKTLRDGKTINFHDVVPSNRENSKVTNYYNPERTHINWTKAVSKATLTIRLFEEIEAVLHVAKNSPRNNDVRHLLSHLESVFYVSNPVEHSYVQKQKDPVNAVKHPSV